MAFTDDEQVAITRLRNAFRKLPDTVKLYVIDGKVTACRVGTPSSDAQERVGDGLREACFLTHMHDDKNFGDWS